MILSKLDMPILVEAVANIGLVVIVVIVGAVVFLWYLAFEQPPKLSYM